MFWRQIIRYILISTGGKVTLTCRRFGCERYVKILYLNTKFSPEALKTVLVGYLTQMYVFWQLQSNKFRNSKHAGFNEKLIHRDAFRKSGAPESS